MRMQAGLSITILGMSIVFAFIALLAVAISFLARFAGELPHEESSFAEVVAVIGAALHAHRKRSKHEERRD